MSSENLEVNTSTTQLEKPEISSQSEFSAFMRDGLINYTWQDMSVTADIPLSKKFISSLRRKPIVQKNLIQNVYGEARPGELLAIMGPSGSGKTTLLNCLTFRTDRHLEVSGLRLVNGVPVSSRTLAAISGYVQQVDLFIGTLTVKESLIFHAMLRMQKDLPLAQRLARVEEVMLELNLKKCENTIVGIPGKLKGVSGGEMKRLSFATEVLTDPTLLFCDEPTSGLDSYMALNVISLMRDMAKKGKTIISTIHQPSSGAFAMFDKILFMAEGTLVFLGTPKEASILFESLGAICPSTHNPADFYIHVLSVVPGREEDCRAMIMKICDGYCKSERGMRMKSYTTNLTMAQSDLISSKMKKHSKYKASWLQQFVAVFWRSWISVLKDPTVLRAKMIQTILLAMLIGLVYFQQELDQDGVMNINGAIFISLANTTFQNVFAVIDVFCAELPIFMRECTNGMYRSDVYFLSKTLAEFPIFIALPSLFTTIIYYMIGMNPPIERFLGAMVAMILVGNCSTSFGYLMSCTCANVGVALSVAPPIVIPFLLFGGYFLNTRSIPSYLSWLHHLSWFKYGNEALLINQWKGVEHIKCTKVNTTCPQNGLIVLETVNFSETNYYIDLIILVVIGIGFRFIAFIALLIRATFNIM
nr:protein white [Cimex lectularius]